jgi:hypothetical protein
MLDKTIFSQSVEDIEKLRIVLTSLSLTCGFVDHEVVELSNKLDSLIVKYMKEQCEDKLLKV